MPAPLNELASAADEAIRSWPDVRAKNVFGHHGYVRSGKMFAFVAGDGMSFRAADNASAEKLYEAGAAAPFVYHGEMEMRGWPVIPLASDKDLASVLTAVREAYEMVG